VGDKDFNVNMEKDHKSLMLLGLASLISPKNFQKKFVFYGLEEGF